MSISFNSKTDSGYQTITAPYYNAIRPTTVVFEQEGVSAFVNSLGHIEFFDAQGTSLGFVDRPAAESPELYAHSGQYGTVEYTADGREIRFRFPVYEWDDFYPHCDGESDRWNRRTVRHFSVVFNCGSKAIRIEE